MARFHIGSLRIGDWIDGAHLERIFKKNELGEISVEEIADKGAAGLRTILQYWDEYQPLFNAATSDEAGSSAQQVEDAVKKIAEDLDAVKTLPDVVNDMEQYTLSPDPATNKFYHEFLTSVAFMSKNGFSSFELVSLAAQAAAFVKTLFS